MESPRAPIKATEALLVLVTHAASDQVQVRLKTFLPQLGRASFGVPLAWELGSRGKKIEKRMGSFHQDPVVWPSPPSGLFTDSQRRTIHFFRRQRIARFSPRAFNCRPSNNNDRRPSLSGRRSSCKIGAI